MLNEYVWNLYMKTDGKHVSETFKIGLKGSLSTDFADFISELQQFYSASSENIEGTHSELCSLAEEVMKETASEQVLEMKGDEAEPPDIDAVFGEWYQESKNNLDGKEQELLRLFCTDIEFYTTSLALEYPSLFVPYYFFANYNVLERIAESFDIALPEIPKKADCRGRIWHYAEICKALQKFREENSLSPYELCAFLSDFAPKYIGGTDCYLVKDLPEPRSAYFVGGSGRGSDSKAENDTSAVMRWQCNPETRAGDMIVMYLTTPVSAITSIWRSHSIGFVDPFFYYYHCTYIGSPVKTTHIPLEKIRADPVLGSMPLVKKNMQGINGVELMPSEYNYIVELTSADVPMISYAGVLCSGTFATEKEVEEGLIKPLISRLGYSERDYRQQLYIEIGNHNHALIPDFVLRPVVERGHYSAFAIIEAKRSIKSQKQLEGVKTQARSYAKLLGVRYAVIASQEKIWILSSKDDYTEELFTESWDALKDENVFYRLSKMIGST